MEIKYFTDSNSAAGYVSLQQENLTGIKHIYHLKSPTDTLVHELLEQIAKHVPKPSLIEYIYGTFNPQLLTGLVMRELDTAFVSGKVVVDKAIVIDLDNVYCTSKIKKKQQQLDDLNKSLAILYEKMYLHYNAALDVHDEWEKIYIDRIDVTKADLFSQDVLNKLFGDAKKTGRTSSVVKRFFGTSTPVKSIDFIPELTAGLKRYFIKGRPGTGKSTLMKLIVKKAEELGFDVDVYHCALDPKSLDMVVVSELGFCIFDATAPHEYEPHLISDEIFDTYHAFIAKGTDEQFATYLSRIESEYDSHIKLGKAALKEASMLRTEIENIYKDAEIASKKDELLSLLTTKL